ncbi:MAG: hypothetical protein N2C12_02050, partial [Planctomycetales bacterium]
GFSRLLGFGHLPWIPMVIYLSMRMEHAPLEDRYFRAWLWAVIVLDSGSILLDAANVIRYFAGDRDEMVAGLSKVNALSVDPSPGSAEVH